MPNSKDSTRHAPSPASTPPVGASAVGGTGRETGRERLAKLEALLEKMQTDLDVQLRIQARFDILTAKHLR